MAAYGRSRSTQDFDFMTTDKSVLRKDVWEPLRQIGATVEVNRGDYDDPLAGVVRIKKKGERSIDVVVGKYIWEREVFERATLKSVGGEPMPVPLLGDLILLKVSAGGPKDLDDVRALMRLHGNEETIAAVNALIDRLPKDAQRSWSDILASL